jgi:hypothetical protein
MFAESYGNPAIVQWLSPRETPMLKDTSLQTSPQLALVEQSRVVVALSEKQVISLFKKSEQSGIPFDTLKEVYQRGYVQNNSEQIAYNRVNSFIAGGAAIEIDQDLLEMHMGKLNKLTPAVKKDWRENLRLSHAKKKAAKSNTPPPSKEELRKMADDAVKNYRKEELNKLSEKRGLWDNIHAKRNRIKNGSGEHMRKPGSKGAPTDASLRISNENTDPCWDNYKQVGVKKKNGKTVPNCVPKEEYTGAEKVSNNPNTPSNRFVATKSLTDTYKKDTPGYTKTIKRAIKEHCSFDKEIKEDAKGYKNPTGGLTQKGRDHFNRETGSHLKAPVTTSPSKLKAGSKSAGRRKSFCARMGGMEGPMKKPNGEPTRKALALRKWNC